MPNYWDVVNEIIARCSIILEVVDARFVQESRNQEIEKKIAKAGKKVIVVVNKCDLVDKEALELELKDAERRKKDDPEDFLGLEHVVFVSSTEHLGTTMLKKKILSLARGEKVMVGVVGYPNMGKSSIINTLAGREKARASSHSGFTRGKQRVRVSEKITMFDTPGVIPFGGKDEPMMAMFGAVDAHQLKDPEGAAIFLLDKEMESFELFYEISAEDSYDLLEAIGRSKHILQSGGEVDMKKTAIRVVDDWQKGKISNRL